MVKISESFSNSVSSIISASILVVVVGGLSKVPDNMLEIMSLSCKAIIASHLILVGFASTFNDHYLLHVIIVIIVCISQHRDIQ